MSEQIYSVVTTEHGKRRVVMETNSVFQAFQLIAQLSATAWHGEPDQVQHHVEDADGNIVSQSPAPPETD